jgi:hypothetical protein
VEGLFPCDHGRSPIRLTLMLLTARCRFLTGLSSKLGSARSLDLGAIDRSLRTAITLLTLTSVALPAWSPANF